MTESEPTHRVVRKAHRRSSGTGGPAEVYEPGDRITPTERELARIPSRFEPLDDADDDPDENSPDENDESDATGDANPDTSEDAEDDTDADEATESAESEATDGPPDPLTSEWVESADYNGLRSVASRFEDVNGNWGEDRLRAELLDRAE